MDGSPTRLAANGPHIAGRPGRARHRSRYRETAPPWFQLPWPRSRACRFQPWIRARPGDAAEPPRRPSASPHDRRTCNRPETGPRLPRSLSRSPLPSNWLFEVSRRQRKPFSRPRPRRPKGPGLILSVARQDLAGAARLLCNFHACGPAPGSTQGSVGAQVLIFGMPSQRIV